MEHNKISITEAIVPFFLPRISQDSHIKSVYIHIKSFKKCTDCEQLRSLKIKNLAVLEVKYSGKIYDSNASSTIDRYYCLEHIEERFYRISYEGIFKIIIELANKNKELMKVITYQQLSKAAHI